MIVCPPHQTFALLRERFHWTAALALGNAPGVRIVGIATVLLLSATVDPRQAERARAAYERLGSVAIEAKPADALPAGVEFGRIDVSERIRSASFGHPTTLLVPTAASGACASAQPCRFWVEYGRSTNATARLFGPFSCDS
jgi:hypothetical protein